MLIRSIRAENFRRFVRVDIEQLPEHGLIGVEGPNESGKSTLGELLLFAFFGRARGEIDAPVSSLIRWGAESLRVEVEFLVRRLKRDGSSARGAEAVLPVDETPVDEVSSDELSSDEVDGREYMIYREIDRRGANLVKVLRLPEREEVAVGSIDVRGFIAREIRFDFEEFQRSFYHGQLDKRRWADSGAQSDEVAFLEVATGISYLRAAIRKARAASREHEERFAQVQMELDRNRAQIERHDRNVQKIPALTEKLGGLEARIAEKDSVVTSGRDEVGQLRGEARRLERRAVAMESAGEGVVSELADFVRKALEEDRVACGHRLHRQPEWESALRKPRDLIGKVDVFLRELLDLRSRIEERAEEVADEIAPGAEDGAPAEHEKCEGVAGVLRASLRRRRAFSSILLLLTALAGGASVAVWQEIVTLDPDVYRTAIGVSGAVTGVFLFLFAWCLAQTSAAKRRWEDNQSALETAETRVKALRTEQQSLKSLIEPVAMRDVRSALERACGLDDKRVRKRAAEFRDRHEELLEKDGERRLESILARAAKLDRELKGRLLDAAQKSKKKLSGSDSTLKKLASDRDRVASELRECRSQERKKLALQEKNFGVEVAANSARSEVTTLLQAIDLLEEAIVSIRTRVRPAVVAYLKTVLPRLTGDRYRDLKVEENLELKVFSSAKGDFLAVSELSGGTGEALGLSLRLALSQAFVMARIGQAQFVFLDEPFKMMDGARSIATLCALEELSAELRQIFVAQPDFDAAERDRCCYLIRTDGHSDRLRAAPRSRDATSAACIEEEARVPEAETPEAETPEAETPEAETPEAETPEAETPEAETPEAETPEAETPEAETPEAETPEAETPETETPETEIPETETPETETPETETPEVRTLDADDALGSVARSFADDERSSVTTSLSAATASETPRDETHGLERPAHEPDDAVGAEPRPRREGQDASK